MRALILLVLLASALPVWAAPQGKASDTEPRKVVQAVRLAQPLLIDGRLDEAAWAEAPAISDFTQRDPDEGAVPTQRTVVHVLYDAEAVYIGARLYDTAPDSIVARLGRRDAQLQADRFGFFVDPYQDRRSGYYFAVNAAGTRYDGVLFNDNWDDDAWDGVWEGKAQIDAEGWTVEMRIPYSQLRFYQREQYRWGINFRRDIARVNERDYLIITPRNESGFVSRFADLVGIQGIRPPRQVEVMPYVKTRAEYTHPEAGNPFNDGSRYVPGFGADVKVGLLGNLTLNATVNPDFGQVEVDPAVVNLSDFETFFPEKRPFFIEGASVFSSFGFGGSRSHWGFNFGTPDFFYSRRIGRVPQGSLPDADYTHRPEGTRILGAAKLTGKVGNGWNVGTIQALTAREQADLLQAGTPAEMEVEPKTYYSVFRGLREVDEGRRGLGFLSTITTRDFGSARLRDEIIQDAYVVGLDGWTFLDREKTWVVTGWTGMSHLRGQAPAMLSLQQSSQHYFQRPDAGHVSVDSAATSLTGFAGRVLVNKQRGNVVFNTALGFIDPGFDINDAGFMFRTDVINGHLGGGYSWTEPGRFTRNVFLIGALFRSLDFDGNTTWTGIWGLTEAQFLNYYSLFFNAAYNPETVNNRRTRGGPLTLNPPGWQLNLHLRTDDRKPWVLSLGTGTYQSEWQRNVRLEADVEWKPASNVAVSLSPEVRWNREDAQWVGAFDDEYATATFGRRYVFGELDQVTLSSSIRLNWTFTPQLSFQLYAQPLISRGRYDNYKALSRPRSYAFDRFGDGASTFSEETRMADPDGPGPAPAIDVGSPDFNFKSLRGNAVLRWEYRTGSTLYLVWTQARTDDFDDGTFRLDRSFDRLWQAQPDNYFMIKLSYWLGR